MNDPPPGLYQAAELAAAYFGTTAERRIRKALRDTVKRWARATGTPYTSCPQCAGLMLAGRCLEHEESEP